MVQGHEDFQSSTVEEREEVVKRWHIVRRDASMSKKTLKQHTKARHTSADPDAPPAPFSTVATYSNKDDRIVEVKLLLRHTHTFPLTGPEALAAHAIESSIHSSVVRASQGDAEQDRLIEHAIRASIAELDKLQGQDIGPEEALQRAIDASVNEAREHTSTPIDRDALTKALRASLYETRREHLDDSGTDSDDEEELNRAIEEAHRKAQAHSSEHKPEDLASVHQHVTDTQPTPTAGQEGTIVTEHGLVERMNDHALQSDSPGDTNT